MLGLQERERDLNSLSTLCVTVVVYFLNFRRYTQLVFWPILIENILAYSSKEWREQRVCSAIIFVNARPKKKETRGRQLGSILTACCVLQEFIFQFVT